MTLLRGAESRLRAVTAPVLRAGRRLRVGWGTGRHLACRFFGSLRPGGPRPADADWAKTVLSVAELRLWERLPGPDRRHSVEVAREVKRLLGPESTAPVLAAALLHDVGKLDAGLRTPGRVAATVIGMTAGSNTVSRWAQKRGFRGRAARYLQHPQRGADLLSGAGSDPLVVAWARDHHLPPDRCRIAGDLAAALRAADND